MKNNYLRIATLFLCTLFFSLTAQSQQKSNYVPYHQMDESSLAQENLIFWTGEEQWSNYLSDILYRSDYEGTYDSTLAFSLGSASVFAWDRGGNNFFYYDQLTKRIFKADRDFTKRESIRSNIENVSGMVYDHINDNLYYNNTQGLYRIKPGETGSERITGQFKNYLAVDPDNNTIFYENVGTGIIQHVMDGSDPNTLITFSTRLRALHFDYTNNRILYITDGNLYGHDIESGEQTLIYAQISFPDLEWYTAYDATRNEYYMTGSNFPIYRIPLDNFAGETTLSVLTTDETRKMVFNNLTDRLYFTDYNGDIADRFRIFSWSPEDEISACYNITYLDNFTIDPRGSGKIYVSDTRPTGTKTIIHRMDFDGKNKEIFAYSENFLITQIEIDTTNNDLYWIGFNRADKAPFGRTDLTTREVTIMEDYSDFSWTTLNPVKAFEIDPINGKLYYTSSEEGIMECDLDMESCVQLTTVIGETSPVLTVDPNGQKLYYVDDINLKYYNLATQEVWQLRRFGNDGTLPNVSYSAENDAVYYAQGTFTFSPMIKRLVSDEEEEDLFRRNLTNFEVFIGNPDVLTSTEQSLATLPNQLKLKQNYPNPFNPSTAIEYQLNESQQVTLQVFDLLGREVTTLVNSLQPAGSHTIEFNASNLSSGTYLYRLKAGNVSLTKTFTLIK